MYLRQLGEEEAEGEGVIQVSEGVGEGGVALPDNVVQAVHGLVLPHTAYLGPVLLPLGMLDL